MAVLLDVLALPCLGLKVATTITTNLPLAPANTALLACVRVSSIVTAPALLTVFPAVPIAIFLPWILALNTNVKVPGPGAVALSLRPPLAARAADESLAREAAAARAAKCAAAAGVSLETG